MRLTPANPNKKMDQTRWLQIVSPKANYCLRDKLPKETDSIAYCLDLALQVACGLSYLHSQSPPLLHLSLNR